MGRASNKTAKKTKSVAKKTDKTNGKKKSKQAKSKKNTRKKKAKKSAKKSADLSPLLGLQEHLFKKLNLLREEREQEPTITKVRVVDKKSDKPILVLIHAEWCGHCKVLKPSWDEMKNSLYRQELYTPDTIHEIESSDDMDNKIYHLNNEYISEGPEVKAEGFPTMGKIVNGRFEKYMGERNTPELIRWAGGSP